VSIRIRIRIRIRNQQQTANVEAGVVDNVEKVVGVVSWTTIQVEVQQANGVKASKAETQRQ
jgi:hypothetical protein